MRPIFTSSRTYTPQFWISIPRLQLREVVTWFFCVLAVVLNVVVDKFESYFIRLVHRDISRSLEQFLESFENKKSVACAVGYLQIFFFVKTRRSSFVQQIFSHRWWKQIKWNRIIPNIKRFRQTSKAIYYWMTTFPRIIRKTTLKR